MDPTTVRMTRHVKLHQFMRTLTYRETSCVTGISHILRHHNDANYATKSGKLVYLGVYMQYVHDEKLMQSSVKK